MRGGCKRYQRRIAVDLKQIEADVVRHSDNPCGTGGLGACIRGTSGKQSDMLTAADVDYAPEVG